MPCSPFEPDRNAKDGHAFSYTHRIAGIQPGVNACTSCGLASSSQPDRQQGGAIPLGLR